MSLKHPGGRFMSNWEDDVNRHALELVKFTPKAADQGPEPLPEDEVAKLPALICLLVMHTMPIINACSIPSVAFRQLSIPHSARARVRPA